MKLTGKGWLMVWLTRFENATGAGTCPACRVAIELHPLDAEGVDVGRCPTAREALDRLYAKVAQ